MMKSPFLRSTDGLLGPVYIGMATHFAEAAGGLRFHLNMQSELAWNGCIDGFTI
jgi:hypothetical protein